MDSAFIMAQASPRRRVSIGIKRGLHDDGVICSGRASCLVNLLCAPLVLPYRALGIFVWPCIMIMIGRALEAAFGCCYRNGCCVHTDRSFQGASALGNISRSSKGDVAWHRISELEAEREALNKACSTPMVLEVTPPHGTLPGGTFDHFVEERRQQLKLVVPTDYAGGKLTVTLPAKPIQKAAALVRDGIEPSDVGQGALGDCWLLSAFACLAEYPGALENLLITKDVNLRGIYKVRLFDDHGGHWRIITVDDRIPCDTDTKKPLFAQPQDGELWVLILEKAFAKLCGSCAPLACPLLAQRFHTVSDDRPADPGLRPLCLHRRESRGWDHIVGTARNDWRPLFRPDARAAAERGFRSEPQLAAAQHEAPTHHRGA